MSFAPASWCRTEHRVWAHCTHDDERVTNGHKGGRPKESSVSRCARPPVGPLEGIVAWSYSVNKGRGAKNRQSMAEAIAEHLKGDYLKKQK